MPGQKGRDIINCMRWSRAGWPARSRTDRLVAGVCGGLGARLGINTAVVRIAFVALALAWVGLPAYLLAWLLLPLSDDGYYSDGGRSGGGRSPHMSAVTTAGAAAVRGTGMAMIVLGMVLLARHLEITLPDSVIWPALCVGLGLGVVLWRVQPTAGDVRTFVRVAAGAANAPVSTGDFGTSVRVVAGTVLLVLGGGIVAATNLSLSDLRDGLLSAGLVVGGLTLILGPWIGVLVRDRRDERQRRVRADERATVAAHLHDSVLQTLALMQQTDDPARLTALARRQERELRDWLYGGVAEPGATTTVQAAVQRMAGTLEEHHDVVIDVVTVGNMPLDDQTETLVAAAGEAMTNAARWSGCATVSVYVETTPQAVEIFVRDRGVGFDPAAVDGDRHGIRDSIRGRLNRIGGYCEINSAPAGGTEMHLRLDRAN